MWLWQILCPDEVINSMLLTAANVKSFVTIDGVVESGNDKTRQTPTHVKDGRNKNGKIQQVNLRDHPGKVAVT